MKQQHVRTCAGDELVLLYPPPSSSPILSIKALDSIMCSNINTRPPGALRLNSLSSTNLFSGYFDDDLLRACGRAQRMTTAGVSLPLAFVRRVPVEISEACEEKWGAEHETHASSAKTTRVRRQRSTRGECDVFAISRRAKRSYCRKECRVFSIGRAKCVFVHSLPLPADGEHCSSQSPERGGEEYILRVSTTYTRLGMMYY